jgi:hypothetical protein
VCNWDDYQSGCEVEEQPSDNQGTAKEQASDTNKKEENAKKEKNTFDPMEIRPDWINENDWCDLVEHRRKHPKKPVSSKRAYSSIISEIEKAKEMGYNPSICIDKISTKSWISFKAVWMNPEDLGDGQQTKDCDKCKYKVVDKMSCWQEGRKDCGSFIPINGS